MLSLVLTCVLSQTAWTTHYERSGYTETGRYAEAVEFCRRLERHSPYARVVRYGISPEGREMIALIISGERAFTPAAAARSKRPLILINNGIHSGEIEGKDSSFIMAREILVSQNERHLMDGANLIIIPVFSVDAHERMSPYNRINQNGPREMGFRATSTNLNLNRDFIKADGGEMRAMLRFVHEWRPDFMFDNHTTNGGDWQYVVTYGVSMAATQHPLAAKWSRGMLDSIQPRVEKDGFPMAPYFSLIDRSDPGRGITISDFSPRYSHGYFAALNRPGMLVETHVLKPYRQRVDATYSINKRTIEYCIATTSQLKEAVRRADQEERDMRQGEKVVLDVRRTNERTPFTFRGFEYKPYKSEISGGMIPAWGNEPRTFESFILQTFEPSVVVEAPAGYAVPPQWTEVIALLELHGLRGRRLAKAGVGDFNTYRFTDVTFTSTPNESRQMANYRLEPIVERRELLPGTVVFPIDQPGAKLMMHMLEPAGPDALVRWGFFNAVFERKEYFESYAMEPIARRMLEQDPKLRAEFEERLKDPEFAKSPQARLNFFFERSPYADERLNKYPIVRVNSRQLEAMK
jgi:hypothetical protein